MNRQQKRAAFHREYRTANMPFSARNILTGSRLLYDGCVLNRYAYNDTTICVSVGPIPYPFSETGNYSGDYLAVSFSDHNPECRMSSLTRRKLLSCFGLLHDGEPQSAVTGFTNPYTFDPTRSATVYYWRPVSECRFTEANLRKVYVDGTVCLEELWMGDTPIAVQ